MDELRSWADHPAWYTSERVCCAVNVSLQQNWNVDISKDAVSFRLWHGSVLTVRGPGSLLGPKCHSKPSNQQWWQEADFCVNMTMADQAEGPASESMAAGVQRLTGPSRQGIW